MVADLTLTRLTLLICSVYATRPGATEMGPRKKPQTEVEEITTPWAKRPEVGSSTTPGIECRQIPAIKLVASNRR